MIVDLLADGASEEEIIDDYPGIEVEDIRDCLPYASEMARERFVSVPLEATNCQGWRKSLV